MEDIDVQCRKRLWTSMTRFDDAFFSVMILSDVPRTPFHYAFRRPFKAPPGA